MGIMMLWIVQCVHFVRSFVDLIQGLDKAPCNDVD